MPAFKALVGPSSTGESRVANFERTCGFYLEKNEGPGAVYPWSFRSLPGLTALVNVPNESPGRGIWAQDGTCLRLAGEALYEIRFDLVHQLRGTVASDANPGSFASSGDAGGETAIASAGSLYIYTLATDVLSAAIAGVTVHQVGYLNGFFIGLDQLTSTIRISDLLDGTTWDPTQFVQRSTAPDRWQALHVSGPYVYALGSETTDVFYFTGDFPFPFAPASPGPIQVGIAAPWSIQTLSAPIWVAQTADGGFMVVRGQGTGDPQRISSHALETAMRGYTDVDGAVGSTMVVEGHPLYVLNFETDLATWVFDEDTEQWTEWPYWNTVAGRFEAHRSKHRAYAFGVYLSDDRATGHMYQMSSSVYTDNGAARRWMRRVPIPRMSDSAGWVFLHHLEIFLESGLGLQSGQGSNPLVTLRVTRDGGQTWGPELTCSAGAVGQYGTRVHWNRLGRFRDGLGGIELTMSDPVPWRIHGGAFEAVA